MKATLKQNILSLARSEGIPVTNVYEFDASKQTKSMSANVSGLFGTTRISMNDNLLNRGSDREILAVLGHEMGHYVLDHVTTRHRRERPGVSGCASRSRHGVLDF